MSMLIQPFSELGLTNEGQRVDAYRRRNELACHYQAAVTLVSTPLWINK